MNIAIPSQRAVSGPSLRHPAWLAAVLVLLCPLTSRALPSFARQINMQCTACHTEFPVLNQFGRQFKLSGYVSQAEDATALPLAFMLQPSWTHTSAPQAGGAAPGFGDNNNTALTQASIFYGGRLFGPFIKQADSPLNKIGIFMQATYDGVGKQWALDNTELRFATPTTVAGKDAYFGLYLNNNPTMEDLWNTTPAWGFPFTGSGLAPTPAAAAMIDGGLAGQVAGVGSYLFWNDQVYVGLGAYSNLGAGFQKEIGLDPTGQTKVTGLAPYWRLALENMVGEGRWEIGTFGLAARTYPGGDSSEGKDRTVDFGFDTQYQLSKGRHDFTAMASWIYERQTLDASSALESTSNSSNTLRTTKLTLHYLYDKTYGFTAQYFSTGGTSDELLYADSASGSPDSDGYVFQLNYLPFNKNGGPAVWSRSNVKFSLQYVIYNRFDGASTNYDGNGANAKDNNTLYLEAWIAF